MAIPSLVAQSMWNANPLGLGLGFGLGAGAYAGASTYVSSPGSFTDKLAAARDSGSQYFSYGAAGMTAAVTAMNFLPTRAAGFRAGSAIRTGFSSYSGKIAADYAQGRRAYVGRTLTNVLAGGEIPSAYSARVGFAGIEQVALKKRGAMIGGGALLGAIVGSELNKDHPGRGAETGAAVGAGAGLAVNVGLRASKLWRRIGPIGKMGALGVLSVGAFGATTVFSRPKYATMDVANPEDYGLSRRMDSMNAEGDLVFGLHNSR